MKTSASSRSFTARIRVSVRTSSCACWLITSNGTYVKPGRHSSSPIRQTEYGVQIHNFRGLLNNLGTLVRNTCRFGEHPDTPIVSVLTDATPLQA